MMYFAVVRDGLDGGAQITASHNPKRIQRHQDGAEGSVPALGRRRHRRHPRHDRRRHAFRRPPARRARSRPRRSAGRLRRQGDVVHRSGHHQAVQRRARRRQRHGRGRGAAAVRPAALPDDTAVLRGRRHVPEPRGQSAHRGKPPGHRRARHRREGGHRHRVGRRRRSLLLHRRQRRVHRRRLRHGAPRRGGADQVAWPEDRLRRSRQLRGQGHRRAATAARRS